MVELVDTLPSGGSAPKGCAGSNPVSSTFLPINSQIHAKVRVSL